MQAVLCDSHGDESVLRVAEVEPPPLTPDGVRIRVAAAGVNRADLLQRRGLYPPPAGASPILGLECAGTAIEVGVGVTRFQAGDRVMALLAGGGYAEEVVAPEACVMATPDAYTDLEAGAFPEVFVTAHLNLFQIGGLSAGKVALVHGGSGGVGTAAIQMAALARARLIVTAGSAERCRRCVELGAHVALDYHRDDLVDAVLEETEGAGVDVVLDCVGAPYLEAHLRLLAEDGRLVVIGLMGGVSGAIDLRLLLTRRLSLVGSTLRSRPTDEKGRIIAELIRHFGDPMAAGNVRPIVDRALRFDSAADAHRLLAAGEVFGKIVLTPLPIDSG